MRRRLAHFFSINRYGSCIPSYYDWFLFLFHSYAMADISEPAALLGWGHIALAFTFILFDVMVSAYFGLGIERGLLTASIRCVVQLAIMAVLLHGVFSAENPWAVAGIACRS